jgi:hypothetical protein
MVERGELGEIPPKGWAWNGHNTACSFSSYISQNDFYTPAQMPPSDYRKERKEQGGKQWVK